MAELFSRLLLAIILGLVVAWPVGTVVFLGCLWRGQSWQQSWHSAAEMTAKIVAEFVLQT